MIFTLRFSPSYTNRRLSSQKPKGYSSLSTPNIFNYRFIISCFTRLSTGFRLVFPAFCVKKIPPTKGSGDFSLKTVLQSGVFIHAAQEHFPAAELQQLAAFLLVEGHDLPLRIHPDLPYPPTILFHAPRSFPQVPPFYAITA